MSIYAHDEIKIEFNRTDKAGVVTTTLSDPIPCRIKDHNRLITDVDGKEITGYLYIHFIPISINIEYTDRVIIWKRWYKDYIDQDTAYLIKKLQPCGDFMNQYQGLFI